MRTLNESIERCGEVIRVARGVAQIRLEANAGCAGCGSRHTCASGDAAPLMIELAVPGKVQAGARVTIAMPASSLTLAALLGYLLPPVALLIGAIVANLAFGNDLAAVLGHPGDLARVPLAATRPPAFHARAERPVVGLDALQGHGFGGAVVVLDGDLVAVVRELRLTEHAGWRRLDPGEPGMGRIADRIE